MSNFELFTTGEPSQAYCLQGQLYALPGFALDNCDTLYVDLIRILAQAPLRHFQTTRGLRLSAAQSNCGDLGWISDSHGYRYSRIDPLTQQAWPPLPSSWQTLAQQAAHLCGFTNFKPDACLINEYRQHAHMSLHQDKNERNFSAPIVSVSLGMSSIFLWGGLQRSDSTCSYQLHHGDVIVWGGADRLRFHGVRAPHGPEHAQLGSRRINLTFRQAA